MKAQIVVGIVVILTSLGIGYYTKAYSYAAGCEDAFNDLYSKLNIKDVDQTSLKAYCSDRAQQYLKR
jgi:hypothetical protein